MERIYLDQASTASPKADGLGQIMAAYFAQGGLTIGRGQYADAQDLALEVLNCRRDLATYFHFPNFRRVIFTNNITHSLNLALKGSLRPGDEVISSSMEHNAVARPLQQLRRQGITVRLIQADHQGRLEPEDFLQAINEKTRAAVFLAASNVSGTSLPLYELADIAHAHHILFIVDSAQVAGHFRWNTLPLKADAFCFTGHKALRGPEGIGGIAMSEAMVEATEPLLAGGTGSYSELLDMPSHLPDRFEAGTPNLPGILGLGQAIKIKLDEDPWSGFLHELQLCQTFLEGIADLVQARRVQVKGLGLPGIVDSISWVKRVQAIPLEKIQSLPPSLPVISLDFSPRDNAEIADSLEHNFHIMTRVGLHCAPLAHQSLGSYPQGTVRFSVGATNTLHEINVAIDAVHQVVAER